MFVFLTKKLKNSLYYNMVIAHKNLIYFKNFLKKISKKHILVFWLFIGLLLASYNFTYFPLWHDESFSANAANNSWIRIIEIARKDTHPPLHLFLLKISGIIFGINDFSMRLPSLLSYLLSLYFVYFLIRKKSKFFIFLSLALSATNPVMLYYASESRGYSLLTFFCLATVGFFLELLEKPTKSNMLGFVVFNILLLYTHSIGLLITFGILIYYLFFLIRKLNLFVFTKNLLNKQNQDLFSKSVFLDIKVFFFSEFTKNKNSYLSVLISLLVVSLAYAPWFLVFLNHYFKVTDKGFWLTFNPINDLFSVPPTFFVNHGYNNQGFWSVLINGLPAVGLLIFVFGLIKGIRKFQNFAIFGLIFLLIMYLVSFKNPLFYIRYLSFITPFITIAVASGFFELREIIKNRLTD